MNLYSAFVRGTVVAGSFLYSEGEGGEGKIIIIHLGQVVAIEDGNGPKTIGGSGDYGDDDAVVAVAVGGDDDDGKSLFHSTFFVVVVVVVDRSIADEVQPLRWWWW